MSGFAELANELSSYGESQTPSSFADHAEELKTLAESPKGQIPGKETETTKPTGTRSFSSTPGGAAILTMPKRKFQRNESDLMAAPKMAASVADTALGIAPGLAGQVTYAVSRALGQGPQEAEANQQAITKRFDQPVGRLFGITQDKSYQDEPTRKLATFIGENIGKGSKWIADQTGVDERDISNMINTGMAAIPGVIKGAGAVAKPIAGMVKDFREINTGVKPTIGGPQSFASVGASAASTGAQIDALIAKAHPELQQAVSKVPKESINPQALQTAIDESTHGIDLTKGQRTGNTAQYAREWNERDMPHAAPVKEIFERQGRQFSDALDRVSEKVAPDIYERTPAAIGQAEIDAFVAKDLQRKQVINQAYADLQNANGGTLPLDINSFISNAETNLAKSMKSPYVSSEVRSLLKGLQENGSITMEGYEALRTTLADEMRSAKNGNTRQAAYIVRQALEDMPLAPEATHLKGLADKARSLAKERFDTIKNVPGYKAAIKEAVSEADAAEGIGSANADTFHDRYIGKGSPADIKRIIRELGPESAGHQAMRVGEIESLKKASGLTKASEDARVNFRPEGMDKHLLSRKEKLLDIFGPEGTLDVATINNLGSRVAMPKSGTFNHSNSTSSLLAQAAGMAGESWLAAHTGGVSLVAMPAIKNSFSQFNKASWAKEAASKTSGLTKE